MNRATPAMPSARPANADRRDAAWTSHTPRLTLIVLMVVAATAGLLTTDADTTARAIAASGDDFVRLLRSMALLKAVMAAGAAAAVLWRLASPIGPAWFVAYALACAGMAAGPGMIWGMEYVGTGALLLHAGLFAAIVLFWRDPAVGQRLAVLVEARRVRLRAR